MNGERLRPNGTISQWSDTIRDDIVPLSFHIVTRKHLRRIFRTKKLIEKRKPKKQKTKYVRLTAIVSHLKVLSYLRGTHANDRIEEEEEEA